MRDLQFALVREGKSDDGLTFPIRKLLAQAGVPGVIGEARTYTGNTRTKLEQVLAEGVVPDLIFVHRDADAPDPAERRAEIIETAIELGCRDKVVAVVPVQETEGWLLTDDSEIRAVVGRPSGRTRLSLPAVRRIEATSNPKEILEEACRIACEKSGARLQKVSDRFSTHRAILLERLDINGPINELVSWRRFVEDLTAAAARVLPELLET
ncbi:hypothetical protein [Mycobacterium colombiense]